MRPLALLPLLLAACGVSPDDDCGAGTNCAPLPSTTESSTATTTTTLDLDFQTEWGSLDTLEVVTDDIFAIWWDPAFDHADDAPQMFEWLKQVRRDCLDNLDMADPPNPGAGFYYNVYIHHGEKDSFPDGWGNGQGTDSYGMPFLTLPNGAHLEYGNLLHEGFHIFQYEANSPGFDYAGDSQWYVESSAQWYQSENNPDDDAAFVEAGAIVENPQLALWHSFSNEAPGDPVDWLYQVRQYGMHTYLFYLTSVAGVDPEIITGGFYAGTDLSPQAYHFELVGGDLLRSHFADWAAHNTGGLDYLTDAQVDRAWLEVDWVGDPDNRHPTVGEFTDEEAVGTFTAPTEWAPRGWAYNVVRIHLTEAASYGVSLEGDTQGADGAASHFEGRLVVMGATGPRYSSLDMADATTGSGSVEVGGSDTDLYVIIAAVPEHFEGYQTYGYQLDVTRED